MNRDAILATLIGFGIGLLITGVLIVSPNIVKSLPRFSLPQVSFFKTSPKPTPTPAATPTGLTIDSPLADTIADKDGLLISGKTASGATVVIQGPLDEDVKVAADGKYAGKITLVEGKNEVTVTSYDGTKPLTQIVTVYYTPEDF